MFCLRPLRRYLAGTHRPLKITWFGPHGIVGSAISGEPGLALIPGLELGLLPALDGLPPVPVLPLLAAPDVPAAAPLDAPEDAPAPAPEPLLPELPLDPELPLGPQARTTVAGASSNATASRNDKTVIVCFLIRSSLGRLLRRRT